MNIFYSSFCEGNSRREGVERVAEQRVVGAYEGPLVLLQVVHLARHVVVAPYYVDLVPNRNSLEI